MSLHTHIITFSPLIKRELNPPLYSCESDIDDFLYILSRKIFEIFVGLCSFVTNFFNIVNICLHGLMQIKIHIYMNIKI